MVYANNEQAGVGVPPEKRVQLTIVNDAGPGRKVSPTVEKALTVSAYGGFAGLAVAYGLLQLAIRRRTS